MSDFHKALSQVLKWENVYKNGVVTWENVPGDHGGVTKYGIDQRSHPGLDIKNLTYDTAAKIYEREYWTRTRCDELPWPINAVVFDIAVNNGVNRPIPWLQKILGVTVDGFIGPQTITAARNADPQQVALALVKRRQAFYQAIAKKPGQAKFLKGWLNRNNDLARFIS